MKRLVFSLVVALMVCSIASGQYVVSAHSGLVNKVEGTVKVDGKQIEPKFGEFPEIKLAQSFVTEEGRAELILTPGAWLRVNENSSIEMVNNKLADTRVKILTGSVLLEVAELAPQNAITLLSGTTTISVTKKGLYRIDCGPVARLRVYDGEVQVVSGDQALVAKKGRQVDLGAVLSASNFDPKQTDEFYRWAARRAEYVAQANVSSAKASNGFTSSAWSYNPWFGIYTYIPNNGIYWSPFGWAYYSPYSVGYLYNYYPGSGYGYRGSNSTATSFSNPSAPHFDSSVGYNVGARSSMPSTGGMPSGGGYSAPAASSSAGGMRGGDSSGGGARGGSSSGGGARGH